MSLHIQERVWFNKSFRRVLGFKLKAKLTKKSIIWPLIGKLVEIASMIKNNGVSILLGPSASHLRSKIDKKNAPLAINKSSKEMINILTKFLIQVGSILGGV